MPAAVRLRLVVSMDRINALRARIALYRRYMREGVSSDEASRYLRQIKQDEAELTALTAKLEAEPHE
ncbi:MAG TPA: hypothetical protein VMI30_04515 [Stellaceae bacterium]|nr:hypothetical protein [Stellaceae bacterium]